MNPTPTAPITKSVAVIIPYQSTDPHRLRALEHVGRWYAQFRWPIITDTGPTDGGWSKGAAVAAAVARTDAEIFVIADADSYLASVAALRDAVEFVARGRHAWVMPHGPVHRLTEAETERVYAGRPARLGKLVRPVYAGVVGGGIIVLSRAAYDTVGGIDPRFVGWGGEDIAFGWALGTLVGPYHPLGAPLVHLWHPHPAPSLRGSEQSEALLAEYRAAKGYPRRMRAVIAGDDAGPLPPLEHPVRFRFVDHTARSTLRLPSGEVIRFADGAVATDDPDLVDVLDAHPLVERA